jgi:hypothetical protein
MDNPEEAFMKEPAVFWLNSTLAQFSKEVRELARQGVEAYGEPVSCHFGEIFGIWRQGKSAFDAGDYARALELAQATQEVSDRIDDMKAHYPYRGPTKELGVPAVKAGAYCT